MKKKIGLCISTIDIHDLTGVGVMVEANCDTEPTTTTMELAVQDVMEILEEHADTSGNHYLDPEIEPSETGLHIQSDNCFMTVSFEEFKTKLHTGLTEAEWFKSIKTNRHHCKFLIEFK